MDFNGWQRGQQPRPRKQTKAQRAPAVDPLKNKGGGKHKFQQVRAAKRDKHQAIDPKHRAKAQDFERCIAVAVLCVAFKSFLRQLKRSRE